MKFTKKLVKFISILCAVAIIPSLYCTSPVYAEESTAYYESYIKAEDLGNYDFEVEAHEIPSNEVLPIIDKSYFPVTVAHFQSEVDNTAPSAIYKAKQVAKVDVIFAFGKAENMTAMQNYIPSFESRLQSAGNFIDAHVEQVETQSVGFTDEFTWNFVVNGHLHQASSGTFQGNRPEEGIDGKIVANGNNLTFYGYGRSPIYDYALFPNTSQGKLNLEFTIKEVNADWHTLDYSGFNFLCAPGDPRSGYSVSFNQRSIIVSGPGVNSTFSRGSGGTFTIKAIADPGDGSLVITVNGNEVLNKTGIVAAGYEFGPFVQWGSHSCSSQSVVSFSDIVMQVSSSKSLGEAISDVSWRDGSSRFVIYVEDTIPEYMTTTDNKDFQYTITKLLNSNSYLINLGNKDGTNKDILDRLVDFISSPNERMGTFIYNKSTTQSMNDACDWIIDKVKDLAKPEDWYLVNTEVIWDTIYNDQEHDLPLNFGEHDGTKNQDISDKTLAETWGVGLTHLYKDEKIFAEKWRYRHFNNYFDNSPVRESFHNIWIEDPVEIFPNPGLYRVNYKRRDNPLHPNVSLTDAFDSYRYWSTDYDRKESSGN